MKLKGAYNQQVRKRKLQRIEEQQHEYYAEYDGTRQNRKRTKGKDGKGFYPQRRGRGSRGRGFYRGRGGFRGRGNFRGRGRPYPSYGGYRGRTNYRGRGRGNYSNISQQRNQQILPRPNSKPANSANGQTAALVPTTRVNGPPPETNKHENV